MGVRGCSVPPISPPMTPIYSYSLQFSERGHYARSGYARQSHIHQVQTAAVADARSSFYNNPFVKMLNGGTVTWMFGYEITRVFL